MSEAENDPLRGLLSEFALGPAWARQDAGKQASHRSRESDDRPRRDDREHGGQRREGGYRHDRQERDGRRNFRGRDDRRGSSRPEESPPAEGIRVSLTPDPHAIHLIGREVHQVARVYPLFDIARILLAERGRCRAVFESEPNGPKLFRGKRDESLFLTREEALRHFWQADWRGEILEEESIEVEPPSGNFQAVARCGFSGEWLGPPNFHSYQPNLRRLHRERFANMPFEAFSARVRTERGEEAVNAWLETMKHKTRWRLKSDDEEAPWMDDRSEVERAISTTGFNKLYKETSSAEVTAAIPGKNLSPALLTSLRLAGSHARKHPAILIPAVCRALEAEHLPVFKRQGKLHTGPARPHALAAGTVLAERPAAMVAWIRDHKPAKLAGLWKAVLPDGTTEPTPEFAADLFWLLQQGHILLFTDDTLVLQEPREPTPQKKPKEPKPPKSPTTVEPTSENATPELPAGESPDPAPHQDFMPVDSSSDSDQTVNPGPPLPGPELLGEAAGLSQDPASEQDIETEERLVDITADDSQPAPEEQALSTRTLLTDQENSGGETTAELDDLAASQFRPEAPPDLQPPAPGEEDEPRTAD